VKLWENAWEEFTPFLRFDTEIRRIVCTTNAIESVNARIRRAVKARGHVPNEQAALKCVYMAIMSLDPTGKGQARWTMRWKTALNAFDITFDGRLSVTLNYRSYTTRLTVPGMPHVVLLHLLQGKVVDWCRARLDDPDHAALWSLRRARFEGVDVYVRGPQGAVFGPADPRQVDTVEVCGP
jgi:hypothetical protein